MVQTYNIQQRTWDVHTYSGIFKHNLCTDTVTSERRGLIVQFRCCYQRVRMRNASWLAILGTMKHWKWAINNIHIYDIENHIDVLVLLHKVIIYNWKTNFSEKNYHLTLQVRFGYFLWQCWNMDSVQKNRNGADAGVGIQYWPQFKS